MGLKKNHSSTEEIQQLEIAECNKGWFLKNCTWSDNVWTLKAANLLEEPRPIRINWSFKLNCGCAFTDKKYSNLLESSKQLIAITRRKSLQSGMPQKSKSVAGYFDCLRLLLCWMDDNGLSAFNEIDLDTALEFKRFISERKSSSGRKIKPSTIRNYLLLLDYLYQFRSEIDNSISDNFHISKPDVGEIQFWPYTPEIVAIPLINGAAELIENHLPTIMLAIKIYSEAIEEAQKFKCNRKEQARFASSALARSQLQITTPKEFKISSTKNLSRCINFAYAACFILISYLAGPRVSEILHLKSDCIRRIKSELSDLTVIDGSIFKRENDYYGRKHSWVAPPLTVSAINALILLSAKHRAQTGRDELWLRAENVGAGEWDKVCRHPIEVSTRDRLRGVLKSLSDWLELPKVDGTKWRLSTHQGRKTFARFVALRDSSSLFALAQQFGHRERAATDFGYSGTDYELINEVNTTVLEQSIFAWEEMLTAEALAGRAGAAILANRPNFKGTVVKQDVKSYARMLVEAGLVLGVCDWGYCIYRQDYSACRGNAIGPNPVRREPSTCSSCKNFALSKHHQKYWEGEVSRSMDMLSNPLLPAQTIKIARNRLNEAQNLLNNLREE